jgi:Caspase domain/Kelch motif/Galactose oxidase, central domain
VGGLRKALIVATDKYEHQGLKQLRSPGADAEALAGVLGDSQIGDFDVQVVRNEPAHLVRGRIEDLFAESRPDDLLLLHFSCHGLKNQSGELFFAARDTRPNRLLATAVSADFVQHCMQESRARSIVLLLDCCYGGAFGQGVSVKASGNVNVQDSFPGGWSEAGRGRAVITASGAMEFAFEGDKLADDHSHGPSVFTAALVEGLASGDADRDEDGLISLNELYEYVYDRVREQSPDQTPGRDIEMQGELYLARSRRRRIHPLPIPPNLEAARTDPNMFTRLGAIGELRSRLLGDNLEAAAGAHAALADTARTDIQYVAEAAAAALREAAIQVVEQGLHFGQVAKGSGRPHRTLHLLGPPLVRACTFRASHSWIRLEETAEGVDVSVDTSHVGALRGDIAIRGPTGEPLAVVPVEVDVVSGQPGPAVAEPGPAPKPEPEPTPAPEPEPAPKPEPEPPPPPSPWLRRLVYGGTAAACVAVLAAVLTWHPWSRGESPSPGGHPTKWQSFAPLPVAVEGAGAASFRNKLWVVGGSTAGPVQRPVAAVHVFDPATGRWSAGRSLPHPVGEASLVSTGGSLYVIGGNRTRTTPLATVYRLDDPDGSWIGDAPLPQPRTSGAAAYDGRRILYAGGMGPDGEDHGDVFALQNGAWRTVRGTLKQPRDNLAAASDGRGSVWFLGGSNATKTKLYRTVERVRGESVVRLPDLFAPVRTPAAVWWPGAGACLLGGQGNLDGRVSCVARPADAWDPPPLSRPRGGLAAAIVGDYCYTVGGYFGTTSASATTERIRVR